MKHLLFIFLFLILQNCSKPKTVYICGDHICVNKTEARQYFEENLSLEVKIIDSKKKKSFDLVELNLKDNSSENRQINIKQKIETKKEIKILNNNEMKIIKRKIKEKEKNNKISKIVKINNEKKFASLKQNNKIIEKSSTIKSKESIKKKRRDIVDICTIIKKCSIDEISKYILKQGNKKSFPDITTRE